MPPETVHTQLPFQPLRGQNTPPAPRKEITTATWFSLLPLSKLLPEKSRRNEEARRGLQVKGRANPQVGGRANPQVRGRANPQVGGRANPQVRGRPVSNPGLSNKGRPASLWTLAPSPTTGAPASWGTGGSSTEWGAMEGRRESQRSTPSVTEEPVNPHSQRLKAHPAFLSPPRPRCSTNLLCNKHLLNTS